MIEDINDRIQAEQALRDREERLRLALSAGVGVWDCDLQGKTAALSPGIAEFLANFCASRTIAEGRESTDAAGVEKGPL